MHSLTMTVTGVLALTLALGGCAMQVRSYAPLGASLQPYRTYDWGPLDASSTGDPRLDGNEFFQARMRTAVDAQLAGRGFEKAASPDLRLHYHASVTQEITISGGERRNGVCEDCQPEVYDAGTLMIDLVDARTGRLVWRGWAQSSFEGVIDDQRSLERRVDEAVAQIMRKLPPRL